MQPNSRNTDKPSIISDDDEIPVMHGTTPSLLFIFACIEDQAIKSFPKLGLKMDDWEEYIQVT